MIQIYFSIAFALFTMDFLHTGKINPSRFMSAMLWPIGLFMLLVMAFAGMSNKNNNK